MHLDSCTKKERMRENEAFEEEEEEMETEAAAPAEETEVATRTQGAAEDQHAAIGEGREGSLGEGQAGWRWVAFNPLRGCRNRYNREGNQRLDSGWQMGRGRKQ